MSTSTSTAQQKSLQALERHLEEVENKLDALLEEMRCQQMKHVKVQQDGKRRRMAVRRSRLIRTRRPPRRLTLSKRRLWRKDHDQSL